MSNDLFEYVKNHQLEDIVLLMGHSLGGKTAMQFAVSNPEMLSKLVVVDISPRFYPIHHDKIIEGLEALDLSILSSRSQADRVLSNFIQEIDVRQFLFKKYVLERKRSIGF